MKGIVIVSKSAETHIKPVRHALEILHDASITTKMKKCELFSNPIASPGHSIHRGHLAVMQHTIHAICDLMCSTNIRELRWILSFCNFN